MSDALYSVRSSWHALSEAESPGPPDYPGVYLQRHSRATFSKDTPVSPMSAMRTELTRVVGAVGTIRDMGADERSESMGVGEAARSKLFA